VFTRRSCAFPNIGADDARRWFQEERVAVISSDASPEQTRDHGLPYRGPTIVMPSQQHSVVAKARRYREQPERLLLVTTDPLTVVIDGFHANHTVVRTGSGLICSCERFRSGGGPCAHVMAVEHRFLKSHKESGD
jgi:SWIM zinc finger